jgi:hypothetical protein
MRVLTLARNYLSNKTIGVLRGDGVDFKTLERPWINNAIGVSCIPEGVYQVVRDHTGRFKYYEVQDVEGRTNIEFHAGNFVEHSQGCILVGSEFNNEFNLVNSNNAINELLSTIGDNGFILHVRAATKDDF